MTETEPTISVIVINALEKEGIVSLREKEKDAPNNSTPFYHEYQSSKSLFRKPIGYIPFKEVVSESN